MGCMTGMAVGSWASQEGVMLRRKPVPWDKIGSVTIERRLRLSRNRKFEQIELTVVSSTVVATSHEGPTM